MIDPIGQADAAGGGLDINDYRAPGTQPHLGRQFAPGHFGQLHIDPRMKSPAGQPVYMQPAQEAHGEKLGAAWRKTPMGVGRPITPTASAYISPVVL